jgi:hypothetical protein
VLTSSRPASSSCFPSLAAWRIGDGGGVWWSEEKKKKKSQKTIVSMVFEKKLRQLEGESPNLFIWREQSDCHFISLFSCFCPPYKSASLSFFFFFVCAPLSSSTTPFFHAFTMALWVDKHRPTNLDKLDYHTDLSAHLKKLVPRLHSIITSHLSPLYLFFQHSLPPIFTHSKSTFLAILFS